MILPIFITTVVKNKIYVGILHCVRFFACEMSLTVVALAQRLRFGVQASLGPSIPYRLLCRPVARLTSTCVTLRGPRSQAGSSGTDERLLALKSSEKRSH